MQVMCSASSDANMPRRSWFLHWFGERVITSWWWMLPLSLVIAGMSGQRNWFLRSMIALLALIALRLWDDVEDIAHDRIRHPERVLCRTSASGGHLLGVLGVALTIGLMVVVGTRWLMFVVVLPLLFGATRLRQHHASELRIVWAQLILLKIPALTMALALGDVASGKMWWRALGLYGFVGGYEVFHDADLRQTPWAPLIMGINISCCAVGLALGTILAPV